MPSRTLKNLRSAVHRILAKALPWDTKLDRLEAKLKAVEEQMEVLQHRVNLGLDDRTVVEELFCQAHGYIPNLENPKTFNEKLAWTKLHRRDARYAALVDKSKVKHHVRQVLGEEFVIPSLAEYDSVAELDFGKLPNRFILKASHGSGWVIIVRDKRAMDEHDVRVTAQRWMTTNFYPFQREPQYRLLVPRLIVEPLLLDAQCHLPDDYKFHCFHGRVAYVQVDKDRDSGHGRSFFDREWQRQPFVLGQADATGSLIYPPVPEMPRPSGFNLLVEAAEKLAAPFDYVRVDMYLVEGRIYFGELTFMHGAATEKFFPRKWDRIWGDLWQLRPQG